MTKDKDHINTFLLATIYKYVGKKELHILPKQKFFQHALKNLFKHAIRVECLKNLVFGQYSLAR